MRSVLCYWAWGALLLLMGSVFEAGVPFFRIRSFAFCSHLVISYHVVHWLCPTGESSDENSSQWLFQPSIPIWIFLLYLHLDSVFQSIFPLQCGILSAVGDSVFPFTLVGPRRKQDEPCCGSKQNIEIPVPHSLWVLIISFRNQFSLIIHGKTFTVQKLSLRHHSSLSETSSELKQSLHAEDSEISLGKEKAEISRVDNIWFTIVISLGQPRFWTLKCLDLALSQSLYEFTELLSKNHRIGKSRHRSICCPTQYFLLDGYW